MTFAVLNNEKMTLIKFGNIIDPISIYKDVWTEK